MAHISKCKHGIGMAMCDECYPKTKLQQGWEEGYDKLNKQHKWHKEIKAWADGAEIEARFYEDNSFIEDGKWTEWEAMDETCRFSEEDWWQYRIKSSGGCQACVTCGQLVEAPQPKPDVYLKVYGWLEDGNIGFYQRGDSPYIGKIKLEQDDETI